MGYNSARYLHTLYQAMNLSFADRDFYYGDPAFPPAEPIAGLLSKDYAKQRAALIGERNDPRIGPGDPYPFQGGVNPYREWLRAWPPTPAPAASKPAADAPRPYTPSGVAPPTARVHDAPPTARHGDAPPTARVDDPHEAFYRGTTSVVAADKDGWLVAVTPSGGWVPAVIAGKTGIGSRSACSPSCSIRARTPSTCSSPASGRVPR
jgi:gamma-glutamyltranspeptidase/glutathione hydrolase